MCVRIVRTGQILAKFKNVNDVYRFWRLQYCCSIARVVLRDLNLLYQGKIFQISISRKRWELAKNAQVWRLYRLIFAIELDHFECCSTPLLWPNLSRSNISMQISLKWLAKHTSYGSYRFWYLPLTDAIPKVVLCDVSILFQCQIFQMLISPKRYELRKYVKYEIYWRWYLPSKSNHCKNHTLRPPTSSFMVKSAIFTKLFQQICLHLHGTRRRDALVLLC